MPEYKEDLEIKNINAELAAKTTIHDKIAIFISSKIGSMVFLYILLLFMATWVSINTALYLSGHKPFDQPFEFSIMLLLSNSIQLITPIFILVSQNIQGRRDTALAEQDYKIAKRTEKETKKIFDYLQDISEKFKTLFYKMNIQQQKIIELEEKQNTFNDIISQSLVLMLRDLSGQMQERPCLLKDASQDADLCDALIEALENYRDALKKK